MACGLSANGCVVSAHYVKREVLLTPIKELNIARRGDEDGGGIETSLVLGMDGKHLERDEREFIATATSWGPRDTHSLQYDITKSGGGCQLWGNGAAQSNWLSPNCANNSTAPDTILLPDPQKEDMRCFSPLSLFCCENRFVARGEEECDVTADSSLLTALAAASALQLQPWMLAAGRPTGGAVSYTSDLSYFHSFCQKTFLHHISSSDLKESWREYLGGCGVPCVLPRETRLVDAAKAMKMWGGGAVAVAPPSSRGFSSSIHPDDILLSTDFDLAMEMEQLMCCTNLKEVNVGDFLGVAQPMRDRPEGGKVVGYGAEEDIEGWLKCEWSQLPACLVVKAGATDILVTPPVLLAILARSIVNDYLMEDVKQRGINEDEEVEQGMENLSFSPTHSVHSANRTLPPQLNITVASPSQHRDNNVTVMGDSSTPMTPDSPAIPLFVTTAVEISREREAHCPRESRNKAPSSTGTDWQHKSDTSDGRDLLDLCWQMKNERARRNRCKQQEHLLQILNCNAANDSPPPIPAMHCAHPDGAQHEGTGLPVPRGVLDEGELTSSFRPEVPLALLDPSHPLFAAAVRGKLRAPPTPILYNDGRHTGTHIPSSLHPPPSANLSYYFDTFSPVHSSYSSAPTDISDAPKKARRYIARVRALQRRQDVGGVDAHLGGVIGECGAHEESVPTREVWGHLPDTMPSLYRRASVLHTIAQHVDGDTDIDEYDDDGSITTDVLELIAGDVNFLPPPETLVASEREGQEKVNSFRRRPSALLDLTPASKRQHSREIPSPSFQLPCASPLPPPPLSPKPLKQRWHASILPSFFSSSKTASPSALHHQSSCIDATTPSPSTTLRIAPFFSMPFRRYKTTQA